MPTMPPMNYVLGFGFTPHQQVILLLRKKAPFADHWNGLGGKVEDKETFREAMVREFHEECGQTTKPDDWRYFGRMFGPSWTVHLFRHTIAIPEIATTTDEMVMAWRLDSLPNNVVPNLNWLVPMAYYNDTFVEVKYDS